MSLTLENIGVVYGENTPFRHTALENISIAFPKGKVTGIIGHTGSGKSTLAMLLNGLLRPTSGRVLLDGEDTVSYTHLPSRRSRPAAWHTKRNPTRPADYA